MNSDWAEKDFYKILGVSKTSSQAEIKKAYRKLARDNHPDSNPGNKAAEERFKDVSEAYSVLSNEKKRKEYDEQRTLFSHFGSRMGGGYGSGFQPGGGFGGNDNGVAPAIVTTHDRPGGRLQILHAIILEVGVEPGVDRRYDGNAVRPCPGHRTVRDNVRRRHMHQIGLERFQVAANPRRKAIGQLIFRPAGDRYGWHADQVAGRGERGRVGGRRIDADMRALAKQEADQPVERLVRPVADVIVIAREQGDAELFGLHGVSALAGTRPALQPLAAAARGH